MEKNRDYGIDLLKIISMLMVVVLHINGQGGVFENINSTFQYVCFHGLESVCIISVNLFALITGYLYYGRDFKIKNIFSLWTQVFFYSFGITLLFQIFNSNVVNARTWLEACFPILSKQYWYFSAYFLLFLLIPFLNNAFEKMSKRWSSFLIFVILLLCGLDNLIEDAFALKTGYSTMWLIVLYLVGAAIKKYDYSIKIKGKAVKPIWYLIISGGFVCLGLALALVRKEFLPELPIKTYRYTSIVNIFASIFFFIFFVKLKIKESKVSKIISKISTLSFGCYLIHVHPLVFTYIWRGLFAFVLSYNAIIAFVIIVGMTICIYFSCVLIEWIRSKLFQIMHINQLFQRLQDKLNKKLKEN